MATFECGPLRALSWPDAPAVDLLSEFRWIIADHDRTQGESWDDEPAGDDEQPGDNSDEERKKRQRSVQSLGFEDGKTAQGLCPSVKHSSSPYKQRLLPAKAVRSPLSPAQRAGKKILQLKTELQLIVAPDTMSTSTSTGPLAGDVLGLQRDVSPSHPRREIAFPQPRNSDGDGITAPTSSPAKSPSKKLVMSKQTRSRSPTSKVRARMGAPVPTPAELDLREKQERLASWLLKNTKRECAEDQVRGNVSYSLEVDARVRAAVTCDDDEDGRNDALWVDPVRSLLVVEVTSETVLGGFVPTRRLAYQPPVKKPASPTAETRSATCAPDIEKSVGEASLIPKSDAIESTSHDNNSTPPLTEPPAVDFAVERARDIQLRAQQQVTAGSIEDALATLHTGIQQILYEYQDNHEQLRHAGFNYSVAAHQFATKLQLQYRHRHRERVRNAVRLQRAWRRFRRSARSRSTNNYDDAHAATIQRPYKRRYHRIVCTRSAARIQKCFRVYRSQKHILHFHHACRLLLARERHRRELEQQVLLRKKRMWAKLKIVLRVLRLWTMHRDSITSLQKRWKGGQCRARYATMLNELREIESERRKREDAFVAGRLDAVVALYRAFLCSTRRGQKLVKYHGELPWIRFRRLRSRDNSGGWMKLPIAERIELLDRMYNGRRVSAWEWWVMARELSLVRQGDMEVQRRLQNHQHGDRIEISSPGLQFLLGTDITAANAATPLVISAGMRISPRVITSSEKKSRWLSTKLTQVKHSLVDQVVRVRRKLSKAAVRAGWRAAYYPRAYYWHHRLLTRRPRKRTRSRLVEDFKRTATTLMRKQFRGARGNGPRYECATCYEPFATTAELFTHSRGATATGTACVTAKQRASVEWRALASDADTLHQRYHHQAIGWKQILNQLRTGRQLPRSKAIDTNVFNTIQSVPYRVQGCEAKKHPLWGFAGFKLTQSLARRIHRQGDRATVQQLTAIVLGIARSGALVETNVAEIPLELVGYVFQALGGFDLDVGGSSSEGNDDPYLMLLRTALYQLVTWNVRRERPGATPSSASPDARRSPIGNDESIDVQQLRSLIDATRTPRHRLGIDLVVKSPKSMLDRCRQTLQSFSKRLWGITVRRNAYRQSTSRGDGSNVSTSGPTSMRSSPMTVSKRAGQNVGQGSAIVTAPSAVVPITT